MPIALSTSCLIAGAGLIAMGHPGLFAYGLLSAAVAGFIATAAYRQHCNRQLRAHRHRR